MRNPANWFLTLAVAVACSLAGLLPQPAGADGDLTIVMMQGEPRVGDFDYNFEMLKAAYLKADAEGADMLVTSELFDWGYAAGDLFFREESIRQSERFYERARELTRGRKTALVLGHTARTPESVHGKPLQNVASVLSDGELTYRHAKMLLPTYSVFEEWRYFEPGTDNALFDFKGKKILLRICEDFWGEDTVMGRRRYAVDPLAAADGQKVDLAISLSASPYNIDKQSLAESIHAGVAKRIHAPIVWNAMVGGVDGLVFQGRSFVIDAEGRTVERLPAFATATATVKITGETGKVSVDVTDAPAGYDRNMREIDLTIDALIYGIQQYFARVGGRGAILGNSGGVDSAVVLTLARLALGPDAVMSIKMPSEFTSSGSNTDADELSRRLGIDKNNKTLSIEESFAAVRKTFGQTWNVDGVGAENSQARLRMLFLQYLSNEMPGWMVLGTANKTELAFGYDTFGGGDKNSLQIIGDLWKTQVRAVALRINERFGNLIPEEILTKKPTAELKPGGTQTDEAAMGAPFWALDQVLRDRFEGLMPAEELDALYRHLVPSNREDWVYETVRRTEIPDFKRRQGAPILRVSRRSFDWIDRRVPIAAKKYYAPEGGVPSRCERELSPGTDKPDFFQTSASVVSVQ